ncbi:MAG: oligosaccharide flippase family protein [Pseudomonadota bacterium]
MSLLRSGAVLFASHAAAAILSFLRNVIVARALGVEEFGIAATFAVIFALVETATDTGLEKLIVRDPDGESADFQGTMQAFFLLRGGVAAVAMVLLAGPFARYMGLGEIAWAYQILAIAPLVRGFVHFDIYRHQRVMNFKGLIAATLAGPAFAIVVVLAGLLIVQDFQVVLWALIGFQTAFVVASHVFSDRAYRLTWNGEVMRRSIRFGLPLLLNGLLFFAIMQGDRMIIGGEISVEVLGWYSVAWLLVSTPAFVMINTVRSVFLPKLSERVDERGLQEGMVTATVEAGAFSGIALIAGFFVLGPAVLIFVYGAEYAAALSVLQPIAAAFAMRLLSASITTIALAGDDTPTPLVSGIVRALFLPLAYIAAISGYGAVALAWIAFIGETISVIVGAVRLTRRRGLNPRPWAPSLALLALSTWGALLLDATLIQPAPTTTPALWMCAVFIGLTLAAILPMRALRQALGLSKAGARHTN